ncbi:MAG: excinuclease ABC subunit UvrA, partial [Bacteroidota bacterium]
MDNAPNNPDQVEVWGAREHNLKNLDISFPRNKLVVVTGISGSGKSSLAFDTIYSEGQRRYMESFSAYTRNFLGNLERPDVDKVDGLSPVIAIEQKTTSRNPRSTVGTTTEIYDYMRLLFARISEAYSYQSGQKMVKQTEQQIAQHILAAFPSQTITLLAPVVRGRKGQHKELLQRIYKMGFTRITVNRSVRTVSPKMQLDRYKTHEICIVIDRLSVDEHDERLRNSLASALKNGKGMIVVQDEKGQWHHFSNTLIDPTTGLSYDEPAPNSFSFNSPYGACSTCHGLGTQQVIDVEALMPDKTLSINQGGIHLLGEEAKEEGIFKSMATVLKKYHMSLDTPLQSIPPQIIHFLLYGREKSTIAAVVDKKMPLTTSRTQFAGIIPFLQQNYQRRRTPKMIAEY